MTRAARLAAIAAGASIVALAAPAAVVRAHPERDLHEPAAAGGLPRRRRGDRRPVVHLRARPRRARGAPGRIGAGPPATRRAAHRCSGSSGSSAGYGSSPRASPAARARPRSRACSCGCTAGSAVAALSALVGPVWHFLDPFSTLHDIGAWVLRRIGVTPWDVADYPERLGQWPAVVGFLVVVWLELVLEAGPDVLFIVARRLHGAHARDDGPVRARHLARERRGLHRLVPAPRPARPVRPGRRGRPCPPAPRSRAACSSPAGVSSDVVMVALGVGSILFDGLSQTQSGTTCSVCQACPPRR